MLTILQMLEYSLLAFFFPPQDFVSTSYFNL